MREVDNQNIIENMIRKVIGCCIGMLWGALLCVVITMMSSCSKQQYIPSSSTLITDTVWKYKMTMDTMIVRDSVIVNIDRSGDTVFLTREKWHYRARISTRRDTVSNATVRTDTIKVPVPVEKEQSWWERTVERPLQQVMAVFIAFVAIIGTLYVAVRLRQRRNRDTEISD